MIVPADKGNAIVVINRVDYQEKIQNHLSDDSTYIQQQNDTTELLRKQINECLKQLYDKKLLTRDEYLSLFANSSTIPLFYALIKTHKAGYPLRPIVSFVDSPSYKIAQYLSRLLMPATNKSVHKLNSTNDAKEKLKRIIVPDNHILVSFDVKALFTSLPQPLIIDCVTSFLDNNADVFDTTRLNTRELLLLTRLCLDAGVFQYDKEIYKQIKGTPMSSPVSVVLAEIVMQHIESQLNQQASHFLFWYRYVDDVLSCIPQEALQECLDLINSVDDSIQFTAEVEQNSAINFLDMNVLRQPSGNLTFKIYRKDTHTNKYLDYGSYHPLSHKDSVVRSLLNRAHTICDEGFRDAEITNVKEALNSNGYPTHKLNKINNEVLNSIQAKSSDNNNEANENSD